MNIALEFHDSTWAAVKPSGADLVIILSPAFVHESAGDPGIDPGVGYWQNARIVLRGARNANTPTGLPIDISVGTLLIGSRRHKNVVPLPLNLKAECHLSLLLEDGTHCELRASGVAIELLGAPAERETFPGL